VALVNDGETLQEKALRVADYEGGIVYENIDLSNVPAGSYTLEIELLDERGATLERRLTDVQVTPRTAVARAKYVHRSGFDVGTPGLLPLALGNQYWAMKRFDDAKQALERAVGAGNPELPMARWKLASVYLRERQPDAALELLLPLESGFPNQYEVIVGLGFARYFVRDFAAAAPYLARAATLRPPSPALLNALGECYENTGDLESAQDAFERSLALQPAQEIIERRLETLKSRTR
jgi:tetratricopeptide (TPR) repeat protein